MARQRARVIVGRPPNYDAIVRALGAPPKGAVFAYGHVIYSPSTPLLPECLIEHELVHFDQQADFGGVEQWWEQYLIVTDFRLAQEIEAYRVQVATHTDRAARRDCLRRCARDLASPMYGNIVSLEQAKQMLAKEAA